MKLKTIEADKIKQSLARAERRAPEWILPLVKILLIILDCAAAVLSFVAAFTMREGLPVLSPEGWNWSADFEPYVGVLLFAVVIRLAMLFYQRIYRLQGAFSYIEQFLRIFKAVTVGSLLIITFTFLFRGGFAFRDFSYSRGVFLVDYLLAVVFYSALHLGFRYLQTLARNRKLNLIPTLIVGSGAEAEQTINELAARPDLGYRVVGIVKNDLNPQRMNENSNSATENIPVLGIFSELPELIQQIHIQEVIITDSTIPSEVLFDTMMKLGRRQRVEFRIAPSLFNVLPQKTSVEQIGVLPMVRLFREPLSDAEIFLKRTFDIVVSSISLLFIAPIAFVIALLVKFNSRGPVFFKQERVGMDGRIFLCYKFRTMLSDADETIHREAYRKNVEGFEEANSGSEKKPVFGKVKDDPRVTKVGKILRRTSLDELPQILNVLKGDMSVVGPRPPIPYEVEFYEIWHRKRLDVKPGITGLWQVSGRNRLTFDEMVRIDLFYIENWSLWLDLKIILLTLPAVFRGDGAR